VNITEGIDEVKYDKADDEKKSGSLCGCVRGGLVGFGAGGIIAMEQGTKMINNGVAEFGSVENLCADDPTAKISCEKSQNDMAASDTE
jgi:hypothetical protein